MAVEVEPGAWYTAFMDSLDKLTLDVIGAGAGSQFGGLAAILKAPAHKGGSVNGKESNAKQDPH